MNKKHEVWEQVRVSLEQFIRNTGKNTVRKYRKDKKEHELLQELKMFVFWEF